LLTGGGSELIPEKIRKGEDYFGIENLIRSFTVSDLYPPTAGRQVSGGKMLYWKGWGAE